MPETTEQWEAMQRLFEEALNFPESEREDFLSAAKASRESVEEVRAMLAAHLSKPLNLEGHAENFIQAQIIPERLGPYKIIRQIGHGGMSVVYLANRDDNTFNREVAIKTLDQVINSAAMHERFRHEQRIHARLNHPHIARLLDAGVSPSHKPYLVMQYVNGLSIADYVKTHNCNIKQRLGLMVQVCDAITFAHAQLILHRDIKPSNIMVDENGQAMLLDFGIAKLLNEGDEDEDTQQLTQEGDTLMTLSYASPEQIRGEELSTASDIYSLGVVFYELLSGHRPFYGKGDYQLSDNILNQDPTPPLKTLDGKNISLDLQAIAMLALEKQPQDRYPSVAAFSADIKRFLNHEVIVARPPNLLKRMVKFWRRNPVTAPLGTLALLGIITSLAAALWQTNQAEQQRLIANNERDRAEQVADLMLDLFDSDPYADDQSRRDDITLREFLTSRAKNMENRLNDQPSLQAKLFGLFANLYANLGQLKLAEPMAIKALNAQRKIHGNQHLDVARSANTLGTIRQYQARYDEAELLFREALSIRTQLLPESDPDLANSINNLSTVMFERGRAEDLAEIMALDQRTLEMREKHFGQDSLQVAESLNNIAAFKVQTNQAGDWQVAESMYRRALDIRLSQLGNAHASTGNTMSNLASLLRDKGQLAEAEKLFLNAISITERALGIDHPRLSAPLYGLGNLYQDQSRWQEAIHMHQRSLQINKNSLPKDHPFITDDLSALIHVNLKLKKPEQARKILEQLKSIDGNDIPLNDKVAMWQKQIDDATQK